MSRGIYNPQFRTRFHHKNSFWNARLADNAPLASTSEDYVARLNRQINYSPSSSPVSGPYAWPYTVTVNQNQYSFPIYNMPLDHPTTRVTMVDYSGNVRADSYANGLPLKFLNVPVPLLEHCKPGANAWGAQHQIEANGTDQSVAFLRGNELWEFWKFKPNANVAGGYSCQWGGYISNFASWIGLYRNSWGTRATSTSALGGLITAEDEASGEINHALAIAVACSGNGSSTPQYIPPFTRGDTNAFNLSGTTSAIDADRLPHGVRFRLPASFDVEAWVTSKASVSGVSTTLLRQLCLALKNYGMYVADSTSGVLAIHWEDIRAYGTPYHPYATRPTKLIGSSGSPVGTFRQLPFTQLQQVAPPDASPLVAVQGLVRYGGVWQTVRTY